jgi:hypothetical protein
MLISRLLIVVLMGISSAVFSQGNSGSLSNSEALGIGTQNSRALDSSTPNDDALDMRNSSNRNNSQNRDQYGQGKTAKPTQSDPINQGLDSD